MNIKYYNILLTRNGIPNYQRENFDDLKKLQKWSKNSKKIPNNLLNK